MRVAGTVLSVLTLVAAVASGQSLSMGTDFTSGGNSSDGAVSATRTDVDLFNPATATGLINTVHFYWSQSPCPNAAKIKFFRRNGNSLTMTAERGPFTPTGDTTVTLSPAVQVQQGDLIGIARVSNCGNASGLAGAGSYVVFNSDVTGTVDITAGLSDSLRLALYASGTTSSYVAGVIPAAGSTAGNFGSNFKTAVQLYNPLKTGGLITGNLTFHPAGTVGRTDDPVFSYYIPPGGVLNYSDIVALVGRSGLGSIDLVLYPSLPGATVPLVVTRVYNDAGAAGTTGFTEDVIDPSAKSGRVLNSGSNGFILTPPDVTKARINIGVRTLFAGATLTAQLRDSSGAVLATVNKSYQPNWFEQASADSFFGMAVGSNQVVAISITGGSAVIYGSTTDNTTNDSAIQFMTASPIGF